MAFLKKIWAFLKVSPKSIERRGDPDYNKINVDKIKEELDLEKQAKKLGEANLPSSDAVTMVGIEKRIVQIIDRARQDFLAWGIDRLTVLNQRIEKLNVTLSVSLYSATSFCRLGNPGPSPNISNWQDISSLTIFIASIKSS